MPGKGRHRLALGEPHQKADVGEDLGRGGVTLQAATVLHRVAKVVTDDTAVDQRTSSKKILVSKFEY